mmetsp:Transcript_16720/g.46714  ORF Transcript_16720/g.46714 Transcript_16720/m.46714 type:complete len:240 (-) Transcript_16720:976-1695(-)
MSLATGLPPAAAALAAPAARCWAWADPRPATRVVHLPPLRVPRCRPGEPAGGLTSVSSSICPAPSSSRFSSEASTPRVAMEPSGMGTTAPALQAADDPERWSCRREPPPRSCLLLDDTSCAARSMALIAGASANGSSVLRNTNSMSCFICRSGYSAAAWQATCSSSPCSHGWQWKAAHSQTSSSSLRCMTQRSGPAFLPSALLNRRSATAPIVDCLDIPAFFVRDFLSLLAARTVAMVP